MDAVSIDAVPEEPLRRRKGCHARTQPQKGEKIIIGDNICVVVISVHGNRMKLGIEGPAEVPIQRLELLDSESAALRKVDQHDHRSKLPVAVLG